MGKCPELGGELGSLVRRPARSVAWLHQQGYKSFDLNQGGKQLLTLALLGGEHLPYHATAEAMSLGDTRFAMRSLRVAVRSGAGKLHLTVVR